MKYLVMETFTSYAVVLDEEGRFIKAANMNYTAGQTVSDIFPMEEDVPAVLREQENKKSGAKPVYFKRFIAAAACLAVIFAGILNFTATPYASVYISINPSVRIDVDKNDIVKNVRGTNRDGEALVKDFNGKGKTLDSAVNELIDLAIEMDYLHDGGKIDVNLEGETTWVENHSRQLTDRINTYLEEKITITIQIESGKPSSDSDYSDSDYDNSRTDSSGYNTDTDYDSATEYDTDTENNTDYRENPDSNYEREEDSRTDYEQESESDYQQSDYGTQPAPPPDDKGESNYTDGATDYGNRSDYSTPYSESDYEEPEEDSRSEYDEPDEDEDEDEDDGDSEYE